MKLDPAMPILVVDDYRTMLKVLRGLLHQIGLDNVDEASDGEEALRKLRERPYRLVISDWNMTGMNGLDLLTHIRRELPDLRFIMVTSESKTEHVLAARRAGVDHYIVKPFNAQTLRSKIEAACAA